MLLPFLITIATGYLLGALPFGWLVARAKGIDIFEHGSRNPGATNVRRVLGEKFGASGKRLGTLVFVLDFLKGAVAAGWMRWLPLPEGAVSSCGADALLLLQIVGMVAALLGHSFSCFTRFKGGKGVATGAGGFLVLMPLGGLAALGVWLIVFFGLRYVSLASIVAALSLPFSSWLLGRPWLLTAIAALVSLFVVVRHRANIRRLLDGTEHRFVNKPAGDTP